MSQPVIVEKFAVGQSVRRLEDPRLLQGLGRYSDDVSLPRQAYAGIVRSPHAHALIRGLDVSKTRKASGVLAVLTGAEAAADGLGTPADRRHAQAARRVTGIHPAAAGAGARARPPRR